MPIADTKPQHRARSAMASGAQMADDCRDGPATSQFGYQAPPGHVKALGAQGGFLYPEISLPGEPTGKVGAAVPRLSVC